MSNPIASETIACVGCGHVHKSAERCGHTDPKKFATRDEDGHCTRCGIRPEEGTEHECPEGFWRCSCKKTTRQPTSDPSGKGAETAKEWLTSYISQFPECIGSPECDGYLAGEEHEKGCPCFGLISPRYPAAHEVLEAYAASLRQQLSEAQAEKLAADMTLDRLTPTLVEFSRLLEEEQNKVAEAQRKVSQLEADKKELISANFERMADVRVYGLTLAEVRSTITERAELKSQVSVLTKERDEARSAIIYGDKESVWGVYRHADESLTGSNLGAWYSTAVFHRKREDAAVLAGIKFGDHPDNFIATNVRAERAESRLSAVSEVVRTADAANDSFWLGRLGTDTLTQDNVRRLNLIRTELMAALSNYEATKECK